VQGKDAPAGVHLERIRKANVRKVNHTQRTPHESHNITTDIEEFRILTSIMEDLMDFIQANVSSLNQLRLVITIMKLTTR
jgi:hypothetical protein